MPLTLMVWWKSRTSITSIAASTSFFPNSASPGAASAAKSLTSVKKMAFVGCVMNTRPCGWVVVGGAGCGEPRVGALRPSALLPSSSGSACSRGVRGAPGSTSRAGRAHLEGGVCEQEGQRGAVVEVEVRDERDVDVVQVLVGEEGQRVLARQAGVDAAVKHHLLAAAEAQARVRQCQRGGVCRGAHAHCRLHAWQLLLLLLAMQQLLLLIPPQPLTGTRG